MKKATKSKIFILALIIVACLIVIVMEYGDGKKGDMRQVEGLNRQELKTHTNQSEENWGKTTKENNNNNNNKVEIEMPEGVKPKVWERFLALHKRGISDNAEISFYGKVVDQYNNPVPSVKITFRVSSYEESVLTQWTKGGRVSNSEEIIRFTGEDGLFYLGGVRGRVLYVDKIEKDDYVAASIGKKSGFGFSKSYGEVYTPDKNSPEVFKMWKKEGAEPLIKNNIKVKVTTDNKEYYVDLVKGKSSSKPIVHAGLILKMHAEIENNKLKDWGFVIKAVDGGVCESNDLFLYRAPDHSYQSELVVLIDESNPQWPAKKKVYVESRNGEIYAALVIEAVASHDGMGLFHINSLVNPNGSKNLEYDPEMRIKK